MTDHPTAPAPFSSNAVRLSLREWAAVLAVAAVVALFGGPLWTLVEPFEPGADYRVPYDLTEDYWHVERLCRQATAEDRVLVFGDSVVWGQYVGHDQTLTAHLNREAAAERFVNAGLDGAHPLALGGLLAHHCPGARGRDVIVHLNLLWLSSPQADLRIDREGRLNHPRLTPQFTPWLPAYGASLSDRIGVVAARYVPGFDWTRHLQIAYFDHADLARWTMERPYANPVDALRRPLPRPEDDAPRDAAPWFADGGTPQDLPWVTLESSRQWQGFRSTIESLLARGNRVAVISGPLNEHMLVPADVTTYRTLRAGADAWLAQQDVLRLGPPVLPSELYADLSHPLNEGYARLAAELWQAGLSSWTSRR